LSNYPGEFTLAMSSLSPEAAAVVWAGSCCSLFLIHPGNVPRSAFLGKSWATHYKSLGKTDLFWEAEMQLLRELETRHCALEYPPGILCSKILALAAKHFQLFF